MLAIEYALNYQANTKGLVISNMMASVPAYVDYAQKALMPAMDPTVLAEIMEIEAKIRWRYPICSAATTSPSSCGRHARCAFVQRSARQD